MIVVVLLQSYRINAQSSPPVQWQNTIGAKFDDLLYSVCQTNDGGYLLGGTSYSNGDGDKTEATQGFADYWVIKLDVANNIVWQNDIGGSGSDFLRSVIQTSDGGYLLAGYSNSDVSGDKTTSNFGDYDYWIVKIESNGNLLWQSSFGGSDIDQLYSAVQMQDGNYLIAGFSWSGISGNKTEATAGLEDYWVVKIDNSGNQIWQNDIGGSSNDELYSAISTTDGGALIGGWSFSGISGDKTEISQGQNDFWVVKLTSSGTISWQNDIGGSGPDGLYTVAQTTDGGYLLGGFSSSGISGDKTEANLNNTADYWVVKIDAVGNILWQNDIGGNSADLLYSVSQTADGNLLLAGLSFSGISGEKTESNLGFEDYWIIKLDNSGNLLWQNTMGGAKSDQLYSVIPTDDEGFLISGYSKSDSSTDKSEKSQGNFDFWLLKFFGCDQPLTFYADADGDGFGNLNESILSCTLPAGYVTDSTDCDDANSIINPAALEICANEIDDNCDGLIDENCCGVPIGETTINITPTSAKIKWDAVLNANKYKVAFRISGSVTWTYIFVYQTSKKLKFLTPDTVYEWQVKAICIAAGLGNSDWSPIFNFTTPQKIGSPENDLQVDLQIFPNPNSGNSTIELIIEGEQSISISVVDLLGREVYSSNEGIVSGTFTKQLDLSNLPSGTYFLKVIHEGVSEVRKMVIEK